MPGNRRRIRSASPRSRSRTRSRSPLVTEPSNMPPSADGPRDGDPPRERPFVLTRPILVNQGKAISISKTLTFRVSVTTKFSSKKQLEIRVERKHPKQRVVHKTAYLSASHLVTFLDSLPQILTLLDYLKRGETGEDRGSTTIPLSATRQVKCHNYKDCPIARLETLKDGAAVEAMSIAMSYIEIGSIMDKGGEIVKAVQAVETDHSLPSSIPVAPANLPAAQQIQQHEWVLFSSDDGSVITDADWWSWTRELAERGGESEVEDKVPRATHYQIWSKDVSVPPYTEVQEEAYLYLMRTNAREKLADQCEACQEEKEEDGALSIHDHSCKFPLQEKSLEKLYRSTIVVEDELNHLINNATQALGGSLTPTIPHSLEWLKKDSVKRCSKKLGCRPNYEELFEYLEDSEEGGEGGADEVIDLLNA